MTNTTLNHIIDKSYQYGFETDVGVVTPQKFVRSVCYISKQNNEPDWVLDFRLKAYRWPQTLTEPYWAKFDYPPIDYQNSYYRLVPKKQLPV